MEKVCGDSLPLIQSSTTDELVTTLKTLPRPDAEKIVTGLLKKQLFTTWTGDIDPDTPHIQLYKRAIMAYAAIHDRYSRPEDIQTALYAAFFAGGAGTWWPDKLTLSEGRIQQWGCGWTLFTHFTPCYNTQAGTTTCRAFSKALSGCCRTYQTKNQGLSQYVLRSFRHVQTVLTDNHALKSSG
jgi:hypothetical protein